jgi:NADH-quinone oxidoreductase subunit C
MHGVDIVALLQTACPDAPFDVGTAADQPTVYVAAGHLETVARALRDRPELAFTVLADLTAVDWWPRDPRYEVVYHLLSPGLRQRLRLKTRVGGEAPHVASLVGVWAGAGWLEREVWDLFGIVFDGHADLRRLLMPEDWEGHPLRKDHPVQIKMAAKTFEPLQLTEAEFRANVEADRAARRSE